MFSPSINLIPLEALKNVQQNTIKGVANFIKVLFSRYYRIAFLQPYQRLLYHRTEPIKQPGAGRVGIANIYHKILATYCQTAQCDICRLQIDRHCYAYSGLSRKLLIGIWFTWKTNNCFKKYLSIYSITSNYSYVTLVLTKTNFAILWLSQFFLVVLVVKTTKRFLSLTVLRPILSDFFRKFLK